MKRRIMRKPSKDLLNYFSGDELAANVWLSKYAASGEKTPDEMHKRMAKEFARIEKQFGGKMTLSEKQIYDLFKDFKYVVPQGSVMSQLGIDGLGSLSNCLRGDVKVLTRQGWKDIKDLSGSNQEIMTKGGMWVTAPFKSYGNQRLHEVVLTDGNRFKSIHATGDHRWAIFKKSNPDAIGDIKTTLELTVGDKLYSTYGRFRNFSPSSVGIAHGIVYGDGHSVKGRDNANNIVLCSESRALGKYFPESYISSDETLCEGGSDHYGGIPNYFRSLPDILENKSYLYGWLSGYFAADGHIDRRGQVMICSSKKEDILFVKDVCGVLGIGCTEVTSQTVISNLTGKDHTMFKCFIHRNHLNDSFFLLDKHKSRFFKTNKSPNRWKVVSVNSTDIEEEVFCAEVPDTESFVIEDNILSMNCFVIDSPKDSYGGIFKTDQEIGQLEKRRGGVGTDISTLRPEGETVNNAAKTSTGAVSFMHRFSNTTREVAQGGRRGALMLSIDVRHPDVEKFAKMKLDLTKVTGANISIRLNDAFMKAVEANTSYALRFPVEAKVEQAEVVKHINARELWEEIVAAAHLVAEPGLMHWDTMINYSPDGVYEQYRPIGTNPCSEIAMQANDACRLIAINMLSFVNNPFTSEATFDYDLFSKVAYQAMKLSDDLVELELERIQKILDKIFDDPEPYEVKFTEVNLWQNIMKTAAASRRTGLGFTALGDMIAAMGLKYDSMEAQDLVDQVMHHKMAAELECTTDMAVDRGIFEGYNFHKEFDIEIDEKEPYGYRYTGKNSFYSFLAHKFPHLVHKMHNFGRRNVSWSTVAPTGSLSMLTQTSSGIEPVYKAWHIRRVKINPSDEGARVDFVDDLGDSWTEYPVLHPQFKKWIEKSHSFKNGFKEERAEDLSVEAIEGFFKMSPWFESEADSIDWMNRVDLQGTVQKYTTHSISSTINLPNDVSVDEVSKIYFEAWHSGLKGITVYRDGSRSGVIVTETGRKNSGQFKPSDSPKRGGELPAEAHTTKVKGETYSVFVGFKDDHPYEVFAYEGGTKAGSGKIIKEGRGDYCFIGDEENSRNRIITGKMTEEQRLLTRLMSRSLRHGSNIKYLIQDLDKEADHMFSFAAAVSKVLKKYLKEDDKLKCEECGSENVVFEEGCSVCKDCGSSKCS